MRRFALGLLAVLLLAVTVFADATPIRIADNVPTEGIGGQSYHRAIGFGTDSGLFWAWGGGSLGSGAYVQQLWQYTYASNTWTTTAINDLPTGERYGENTSGSWNNILIATSDSLAGCSTHLYNIGTNTWTTTTALAGTDCNFGASATAANGYYYFIGKSGGLNFLRRLDMSNPLTAWVTLAVPGIDSNFPQNGSLIYDALLDRLVYFPRDNGTVQYYNISANSWTNLGNIFPCSGSTICSPALAYWDNALQTVVGVETVTDVDMSPMRTYRLVWDSATAAHFTLVETWTHTDFEYVNTTTGGYWKGSSVTLPSGNTRITFGSTITPLAVPAVIADRWWTHEQSPLVFVLPIEDNLEAKIQRSLNGLGLTGVNGLLIFSFVSSIVLIIISFAIKLSFNISLAMLGLWNGGLASVTFLPGWILIVGVIVIGLGATIVTIRLFSGGGSED